LKGFFVPSPDVSKNRFYKSLLNKAFTLLSYIWANGHFIWQPVSMKEKNSESGGLRLIIALSIIIIYAGAMLTGLILRYLK
jgi:hypothetical protein